MTEHTKEDRVPEVDSGPGHRPKVEEAFQGCLMPAPGGIVGLGSAAAGGVIGRIGTWLTGGSLPGLPGFPGCCCGSGELVAAGFCPEFAPAPVDGVLPAPVVAWLCGLLTAGRTVSPRPQSAVPAAPTATSVPTASSRTSAVRRLYERLEVFELGLSCIGVSPVRLFPPFFGTGVPREHGHADAITVSGLGESPGRPGLRSELDSPLQRLRMPFLDPP